MLINVYDKGDLVRVEGAFKDDDEILTDPTIVRFKFTTPAGVMTTYVHGTDVQLVRDSTGQYHVDLTPTQSGDWHYSWECSGLVQAAEPWQFVVKPGAF